MKYLLKLPLLFVIFPYFVNAQNNFKPGYRVNLKGDTINGYVDYQEWDNNPKSFRFKTDPGSKYQTYFIANTSAFGINKLGYFEKQVVSVSMNKIRLSELSNVVDTSKITDTVFLKVLAKGKNISLYSYTDLLKTRYYYAETGINDIHELTHYVYKPENSNSFVEVNSTGQLNYLAMKYNPAIAAQVNGIQYTKEAMLKITSLINGGNEKQQFKTGSKTQVIFFAGAGASYSTIKFINLPALIHPDINKNNLLPYASVGVNIYPNKITQKLLFKFQVNFVPDQHELFSSIPDYNNDITTTSLKFKQYTLGLLPQIIYNFYRSSNLKIYAGTGASVNLSTYDNYQYIVNRKTNFTNTTNSTKYPLFDSLWIAVPVNAGIVFNNRIDIGFYYFIPSSITNYSGITGDITSYRVGISYLFGNNKG